MAGAPRSDWNVKAIRAQLARPPLPLDDAFRDPTVCNRVGNIITAATLQSPRAIRAHAEQCLRMARASTDVRAKLALIAMAQAEQDLLSCRKR